MTTTFEKTFASAEQNALAVEGAAKALAKLAKQMQRAGHDGNIGNLRKALDSLSTVEQTIRQEIANARTGWPFTSDAEEAYLRDSYEQELISVTHSRACRFAGLMWPLSLPPLLFGSDLRTGPCR